MERSKSSTSSATKIVSEIASAEKQPMYLTPAINKLIPLAPHQNTAPSAQAAFSLIMQKHEFRNLFLRWKRNLRPPDNSNPLYSQLERISQTYWHRRSVYKQTNRPRYALKFSSVQKATLRLQKSLASLPPPARGALLRDVERRWPDGIDFRKFNELLETLVSSANRMIADFEDPSSGNHSKSGARPKKHVQELVGALIALFCDTGKKFVRRFDTCKRPPSDPWPDDEFVSEAVEFVPRVSLAIDPDLEIGEVVSALKRHP